MAAIRTVMAAPRALVVLVLVLVQLLGTEVLRSGALQASAVRGRAGLRVAGSFSGTTASRPRNEPGRAGLTRVLGLLESVRTRPESSGPLATHPLLASVETLVKAADSRKAIDVAALRVEALTEITAFVVIVEAANRPQSQAIAAAIEEQLLSEHGLEAFAKDGQVDSGWIVLDFGALMVHVMTPQTRQFYKLERKWRDAEVVGIGHLLTGGAGMGREEERSEPTGERDESDPFWS